VFQKGVSRLGQVNKNEAKLAKSLVKMVVVLLQTGLFKL